MWLTKAILEITQKHQPFMISNYNSNTIDFSLDALPSMLSPLLGYQPPLTYYQMRSLNNKVSKLGFDASSQHIIDFIFIFLIDRFICLHDKSDFWKTFWRNVSITTLMS